MKLILALAFFPLTANAAGGCSSCGGYGSVFGPDDAAYAYSCYFVRSGGSVADVRRFETIEECHAQRAADARCQGAETLPSPAPRQDPCN